MQMNPLFNQTSAREMNLRYGTWTQEWPINMRRPPFDTLTIGLHWATVLLVLALFASAWLDALAETQQVRFAWLGG
jgi:hypothetical protein